MFWMWGKSTVFTKFIAPFWKGCLRSALKNVKAGKKFGAHKDNDLLLTEQQATQGFHLFHPIIFLRIEI